MCFVFSRDDFFPLFNWFQLFSSGEKLPKVVGHSKNMSKWTIWKGVYMVSAIVPWFSVILFSSHVHPWCRQVHLISQSSHTYLPLDIAYQIRRLQSEVAFINQAMGIIRFLLGIDFWVKTILSLFIIDSLTQCLL